MLAVLLSAIIALGGGIVTDPLDELRTELRGLKAQMGALTQEVIRGRRSMRDGLSPSDAAALLSPRNMGQPIGTRTGRDTIPDLGSPLLARLRDDASIFGVTGRSDLAGYANMLYDPTLATLPQTGVTIGTGYTSIGPYWEAKYVLNSGTVATTRTVAGLPRLANAATPGSSAVASLTLSFGTNAADMTVVFRHSTSAYIQPALGAVPSWLVGSMTAWPYSISGFTSASVYTEFDDGVSAVATGDDLDLIELGPLAAPTRADVALDAPSVSQGYYLQTVVRVVKSAGATADLVLFMTEPLVALSDDGTVPMFTPAIGVWHPQQLVLRTYAEQGVAAGATTTMSVTADGLPVRVPEVYGGSIVGAAYRWENAITGGSFSLDVQKGGSTVWTPFSSATAQGGSASQAPGIDVFDPADTLTVVITTTAGFLPAGTNDIVVDLYLLLNYNGA